MIVEFAGLPASGKSIAAEALLQLAAREGAIAYRLPLDPRARRRPCGGWVTTLIRRTVLLADRVVTLARHPTMAHALATAMRTSRRPLGEKWFALRHAVVTAHALKYARARMPAADLVVAPEGICQKAFLVFVDGSGAADTRTVQRFVGGAPHPDAVIVLRVTPDVAHERLRARSYGPLSHRFDRLTEDELIDRFTAGQRLLLEAAAHLGTNGHTRIMVLEADDLAQVSDRLGALIRTLLPRIHSTGT